jgi:hypothetical protein
MLRQLPVQRLPIQTEHPRGGCLVARNRVKRVDDVVAFDVGQSPTSRSPSVGRAAPDAVGKVVERNPGTGADDERTLDHILELSHVPRPGMPADHSHRVVGHRGLGPPKLCPVRSEQVPDERLQIVGAFAQRRHAYHVTREGGNTW